MSSDAPGRGGRRAGRLFWKFFALIGLVQIASIVAVGVWIESEHHRDPGPPPPPSMGPPPGGAPGRGFGPPDGPPAPPPGAAPPPAARRAPDAHIPPEPIIGGILASLTSSALLAWLLSKPIRNLRAAIGAAAGGNLDVRVADRMGASNDELRDLGGEFDRMAERLQALLSAQRRLLHDVSHEMRSPLARIQAAIGLAGQQPEQTRAALERIERESARMSRLIGELLALSRLQSGVARRMDEEIDLRELLGIIAEDARFEAEAGGRSVRLGSAVDALVRGNVELLRRAIENVVRNGVKYSYPGGEVRIDATLVSGAARVRVSVRDAGPGIADADLGAVFEPFFRGAGASGQDGHGLGLAIAKRVVESHGGTIAAANLPAGGLRVDIELPIQRAGA